jgi:hypothetical protein
MVPIRSNAARSGQYKLSGVLIRSALVAALGGLLFVFDTAVIAGITHRRSKHLRSLT